ncbi:probable E3 ubiquitin-protein ligase ATL44 [Oryza glaberrima]|uniref:RING-type domain-containing protein n=1 Tax=Oryza barthii TaxID=65489 RepID=A0A0D3FLU5_9ORYZ|nr:probable E3 ubiquitin-protein ligase ATL44 [Oryza glaberrima]
MDPDAALRVELVGVVAVGAVVVVLAAAASGACRGGAVGAFPGGRWRKRAAARVDDVERALGAATLMTYEQAAAAKKASSSSRAAAAAEEQGEDRCAYCQSEYAGADEVRVVQCGHFFHAGCIDRWLRKHRRCPLCRGGLSPLPPLPKPGCRPMPPRTSRPAASSATATATAAAAG